MTINEELLTQLLAVSREMAEIRDLEPLLSYAIDEVLQLVGAERGYIVLLNPDSTLDFRVKRQVNEVEIFEDADNISRSILDETIRTQKSVLSENAMLDPRFSVAESVMNLHLRSVICVPLVTKQTTIGAVYVENRTRAGLFSEEHLVPLEFFGNQAAVSIENAQLNSGLETSKKKVEEAYEATLEGWTHALDLRCEETEGHTQRVVAMTVLFAETLGVGEANIDDFRRGALLHDIGKLGIPDQILHKPGKLTKKEWDVMRLHPEYGRNMIEQIPYLASSLKIPYAHHEKWDGTGYPLGLQEKKIPFPARLFSIVDVWDALTSDRVYRKKWTIEKASEYLESESGKHFDPELLTAFMDTVLPNF
ncbi:MAG: HD-GYP domain-containing protein [Proteobacteria bacterium]|nr:HD-GYP domain-containing protein [Pseudomonadota bacterium]